MAGAITLTSLFAEKKNSFITNKHFFGCVLEQPLYLSLCSNSSPRKAKANEALKEDLRIHSIFVSTSVEFNLRFFSLTT